MNEQEIVKVVRKLIGDTTPIGETHYDCQVLCNICGYMGVVDKLVACIIDDITFTSEYMKNKSVEDCRKQVFVGLKKINKRIEECFEEEEVE